MNNKDEKRIKKSPFQELINNIKNIKHIELIVSIFAIFVAILIYFANTEIFSKSTTESVINKECTEYIDTLEEKLSNVLSHIEGAGNVKVLITIKSDTKQEFAVNKETKTTTSGNSTTTTTTEEIVVVQNKPVVVNETLPQIKGVIVVAQGASSINVKLELLKAVQTLLNIEANNIEIFIGK